MKTVVSVLRGKKNLVDSPLKFVFSAAFITAGIVSFIIFLSVLLGLDFSVFTNTGLEEVSQEEGLWLSLVFSFFLAPFLETLVFQFGLMHILGFIFTRIIKDKTNIKARYIIPGIIVIIVFASQHMFSVYYVLAILLPATLFQYVITKFYLEGVKHIKAYTYTALCHMFYNMLIGVTTTIAILALEALGKSIV